MRVSESVCKRQFICVDNSVTRSAKADCRDGRGGYTIFFKKALVSMRVQGKRPKAKGMGEVGWGEGLELGLCLNM